MKKAFVIILALIPLVFWLVKVANIVEVEQHNDRADFNNAVVGVINDLGDEVTGTEELLLQYTQLEQFDESQQRGMWYLIEDMEFDYQANIDSATERLQAMLVDADEAEAEYVAAAVELADSYSGHDDVYTELAGVIASKSYDDAELTALLASEFDTLYQQTGAAMDGFEFARQNYLDGN